MNHRAPRLLIFDSGVGGLSIVADVQQLLPGCAITYASDNAAFPYGTKGEAELVERVDAVLRALIDKVEPDVVVVACNSASTLALPQIRAHFTVPIVGVVPAIKPAAAQSRSRVIGLLATPGTVARAYTRDLIARFASDCTVVSQGSSELVHRAEEHLRGKTVTTESLRELLSPLFAHPRFADMDTLVLACTHFPLLRPQLQALLGDRITLVDSGEAIARRVSYWLDELKLTPGATSTEHTAVFTRHSEDVEGLKPALKVLGIDTVEWRLM
ncbi:glutamate racemase [Marinimicrobium agarilyticum]|uniref:glutamate racemase n=1 Tax=Marinimicrobium agarilyticum TaxID=306546 RepID=UPI0004066290|nr:glutamate racemase [Marinimicrobium agarilyticum]